MSNEGGISGISQEVREVLSWDQVLPSLLKSHCKSEVVHMISSRFWLSWEIEYLAFIFLCPTAVFSCHYQIHFSLLFLYPATSLFTYSGSHALSLLKRYFMIFSLNMELRGKAWTCSFQLSFNFPLCWKTLVYPDRQQKLEQSNSVWNKRKLVLMYKIVAITSWRI